jgi:hypothetical protein
MYEDEDEDADEGDEDVAVVVVVVAGAGAALDSVDAPEAVVKYVEEIVKGGVGIDVDGFKSDIEHSMLFE